MFHNLVVNHAFEWQWVGGRPPRYSAQLTNTVEVQLDKDHPKDHPQRILISPPSHPYVAEGRWGYRATIAAAAAIDNWRLWPRRDAGVAGVWPAPPGINDAVYQAFPDKRYSLGIRARCSVRDNLLRVRVIALDAAYAILWYWDGATWQAADSQVHFQMAPEWRDFGVSWWAPPNAQFFMWAVSNGTAGAQSIDLGWFYFPDPLYQQADGEEVAV